MKQDKHIKIAWYCKECLWLSISDSRLTHQMDYCKCGKTAVDLEYSYSRCMGFPIFVLKLVDNSKKWVVIKYKKKS